MVRGSLTALRGSKPAYSGIFVAIHSHLILITSHVRGQVFKASDEVRLPNLTSLPLQHGELLLFPSKFITHVLIAWVLDQNLYPSGLHLQCQRPPQEPERLWFQLHLRRFVGNKHWCSKLELHFVIQLKVQNRRVQVLSAIQLHYSLCVDNIIPGVDIQWRCEIHKLCQSSKTFNMEHNKYTGTGYDEHQ